MEAIKEISKVLSANKNLNISIHGYTDNSGDKQHNQRLSAARAASVKEEIVAAGIASFRLRTKGFG